MLEEVRKNYIKRANAVCPNWKNTDVNTLCNLYIENESDPNLSDGYFSAIVLKKWGYIGKHYMDSRASGFSIEDCYDMVLDAICYILKSRSWLNPDKKIYKDPQGPDKCLNMCIWSTRRRYYDLANMDKRKCNFGKWSLDTLQENVDDHSMDLADEPVEIGGSSSKDNIDLILTVSYLLEHNRQIEGLIIDNICFDDCFTQGTPENAPVFKLSKLVSNLSRYDKETLRGICLKYSVNEKVLDGFDTILNKSKPTLSRIVAQTLDHMGKDKLLKETLCC